MEAFQPALIRYSSCCVRRRAPALRFFQTVAPKAATPVSIPSRPGPPPPPPEASEQDNRISRKRRQAELLIENLKRTTDPSKPGSALKKRFWKDVTVQET